MGVFSMAFFSTFSDTMVLHLCPTQLTSWCAGYMLKLVDAGDSNPKLVQN